MIRQNRFIIISINFIIFFLILSSLILAGFSFLSFGIIKPRLDAITIDGNADVYDDILHNRITKSFRYVAFVLLFISIMMYKYRKYIQKQVLNILNSASIFLNDLKRYFLNAIKNESGLHLSILIALFLSGVVIRLLYITRPMHYDECVTFTNYASHPFYMCLSQYGYNNHPFHTILVRLSYLLFGNHSWALRMPALFSGILLIPASYIISRVFYNNYAALLTTVFVSFSVPLISFTVNARGWIMLCLWTLSIIILATYLKKHTDLFPWMLFSILSILGFYTIPLMAYTFGIAVVWIFISVLIEEKDRVLRYRLIKRLVIFSIFTMSVTFMLYLPFLIVTGRERLTECSQVVLNILLHRRSFIPAWQDWNNAIPLPISFFLIIGFFISIVFHRFIARHRVHIFLPIIIWFPLPLMLITTVTDYSRHWLFLLPLYFMTACSGMAFILKPLYRYKIAFLMFIVILSSVLCVNVIRTNAVYDFRDRRERLFYDAEDIVLFLTEGEILQPGDSVLAISSAILEYFFYKHNVSPDYFKTDLKKSNRVFVVETQDQNMITKRALEKDNLELDVLKRYAQELDMSRYVSLYPVKRFKSSMLYELVKK